MEVQLAVSGRLVKTRLALVSSGIGPVSFMLEAAARVRHAKRNLTAPQSLT